MQLDIFEHSRVVILRNAAIDAVRQRDADASKRAVDALAAESAADGLLPALGLLCAKLYTHDFGALTRETATAILRETQGPVATAAKEVFGREADTWLSPLWLELAAAIANFPFDADHEAVHPAPLLLVAGRLQEAAATVERIESWRRQPAPLAWMIEARCRMEGLDAIWPLLAELSWMAPRRAHELALRLNLPELGRLVRGFDAEFEGEGTPDDFSWFPAWVLITGDRLRDGLRQVQGGANTRQERCSRIVLGLLSLERQGRHSEVIEGRKKLREVHPGLFARYMQSR